HQVLRDIVIRVLLKQREREGEVDHELRRQRPGLLTRPAALSQHLIYQFRRHPRGEHPQAHIIRQPNPWMHTPHTDRPPQITAIPSKLLRHTSNGIGPAPRSGTRSSTGCSATSP